MAAVYLSVCVGNAVNLVGDILVLRLIEEHILLHWPVPIKFSDGHDTIDILIIGICLSEHGPQDDQPVNHVYPVTC